MARTQPSTKINGKAVFIAGTKKRKCDLSRSRLNKPPYKTRSLKSTHATRILKSSSSKRVSNRVMKSANDGTMRDLLKKCARHDNRTEIQEKDVKFVRDLNAVVGRMNDRFDALIKRVEDEETAKKGKDR